MILKTIGFDFDQTLADSQLGIVACLTEVCNHFSFANYELNINKLAVSGLDLNSMLRVLFDREDIELQKDKFMDLYPTLGIRGTRLMPGARELLDDLVRQGHRLVLISAKSERNLILSLNHLGLEFNAVYGGAAVREKARFIRESGANLYVGDQLSDVIAANSADVLAVLVNEKPLPIDSIETPHFYTKNLTELRSSIQQLLK